MKDIVNKGQVISLILYTLYGLSFVIESLLAPGGINSYAVATMIFWGVTLIVMLGIRVSELRHTIAYRVLYICSVCLLAVFSQIYMHAVYLVFLMFAILNLTVITFLDKRCFRFSVGVQALCLFILVSVPTDISGLSDYTLVSFLFSFAGLILVDWVGCNIIGILQRLDEETLEYERSLDDLLAIVELKHAEAIKATEAKSSFLSNMSHELRTPLNSIIGMNEMVLREEQNEQVLEYSRDIKSSGEMMLSLVNDILDISKIESGKMNLVPVDFNLKNLIRDISNMIEPKMKDKGLSFIMNVDEKLMGFYYADNIRLKQILVNLLNNAAKYTEKGTVTLTVTGDKKNDSTDFHFSVKDTGMGIREEDLAKLNQKFVRIDEKRNRNIEGTGLGITIVNSFLGLMNSNLKVESEYGKGSDFFFDVSIPFGKEIADETAEEKGADGKFEAPGMKILVIDDTRQNLRVISALLKKTKVEVDTAGSGEEGISKATDKKYDLIFLDRMMPVMDGVETLGKMREISDFINEKTPIVALTADAVAGAKQTYINLGFDDYLSKPVLPVDLENMLRKYWR